jgi:hypothetical protein
VRMTMQMRIRVRMRTRRQMRSRWRNLILVAWGLALVGGLAAGPVRAQSQSADVGKILGSYAKAEGGGGKLGKVVTLRLDGTVTEINGKAPVNISDVKVAGGGGAAAKAAARGSGDGSSGSAGLGASAATYTFETKLPNRYYSEMLAGDKGWIEAFNGKSAWRENARGEIGTLVGPEGLQVEAAARFYNTRLLNPKKNRLVVTYVGNAQVRGRDAVELEVTSPAGAKRQVFFDAQTHLIVKETALVGGVQQEIVYDDYRAVDGVQVPYQIALRRGADDFKIVVNRAAINERVGERTFDFPKKAQVVLPDLKELFLKIDGTQKAIDKMKENYAGTKVETTFEYEGNGKPKPPEVKESTFFYLDGTEVSTLVKKDGKVLSEEEQKKEQARVLKEIEMLQKEAEKKEKKDEKAEEKGKDPEGDEEVSMETFLRACQFVNPRRERFRGADVLVFDFEPNVEFKPHTLMEKIITKLGGVIWIDEKALDVARLDAFFVGDVKIAGGLLANVEKGTRIILEQEFVNNEVWLPTYQEVHVDVKFLMVKGIRADESTRYSDYQKFNVNTIQTIGKPKGVEDAPASKPADTPKPQ